MTDHRHREKREPAYIVSLYATGSRWANDCYPVFLPTRETAIDAGEAALVTYDWAVRYTIRKIWIKRSIGVLDYEGRRGTGSGA